MTPTAGAERRPGHRVVLGVAGGIAAYKVVSLLRLLTESGHDVRVVPTQAALEFVGAPTWSALSGHPVSSQVWDDAHEVPHVRLGREADLVIVAPATADLLARAAHGLADDLLTSTLLTATCPIVLAPAMHTEMWEHPATRANVATLRERGVHVIEPASGRLTGADTGPGRLPEPEELYAVCRQLLGEGSATRALDLAGRAVVVSAGGTREPLDPVRYLGNRSSGKMGVALARAAAARGAKVVLVAANLDDAVAAPARTAGIDLVAVGTALELRDAVLAAGEQADVVVMAAAVADFRPATYAAAKIKKSDDPDRPQAPTVELVRNPDVLHELVQRRADADSPAGQVLVGFAAETGDATGDVLALGRAKLTRKGCDLMVVNEVGESTTFGQDESSATIIDRDGGQQSLPHGPKSVLADAVWDAVLRRFEGPLAGR